MKKVISLPSSPAALRKFSTHTSSTSTSTSTSHTSSTSPSSSPGVAARHATHKAPAKRAGGHGHGKQTFNKTNKSANKKKLALSIMLAVGEDEDEDYSSCTTTTYGSSGSDEDEWERSFDASWVIDEHELALHRGWTDQNGITTFGQLTSAGTAKGGAGGQLRRSPLATNSTLSVSFASLPANERPGAKPATAATTTSCEASCAPARGSRPPSPSSAAATAHISYAQLQQYAATSPASASCHSPSSSPREAFTVTATSASSLLPALDLDRVVAPASLGSSSSRRNTIGTTPRDSAVLQPSSQWKVGKVSPRDQLADGERGNEGDAQHSAAETSPRRSALQISFERFEAYLTLKQHRQQQQAVEVEAVSIGQVRPQPEAKKSRKPSKRSGSKRKKNVRSLNKEDTHAKREKRSEEERRTYRRSQGSPPMLLRALENGDSDSGAAGYMAEEERASDYSSNSDGSSDSGRLGERRFHQTESAPVSPVHSGSSSSSLLAAASLALRSGGFPLSRSRSSEVQAKARRTITKENNKRRDDVVPAGAQSHSADSPAVVVVQSPNNERAVVRGHSYDDGSVQKAKREGQTDGGELTWKTIWQDSRDDGACEGPSFTLASSSLAPPLPAPSESDKRVAKRGLDGRSVSLPPAPLPSVSTSELPPHIEPLPFPAFATSPPTSLAASFSSLSSATSSGAASPANSVPQAESPAQRHRRRAESSGAPQQLMRVVPPPLSPHTRHLLSHPQLSFERVRKVTLSPSLAARQQKQRQAIGVPLSSKVGSESGEVTTFLRSQSEEINASAFNGDGDDLISFVADAIGAHGRATSWRGRSGGEWRNRNREASVLALAPGIHPTDLATQRARVARARSFGLRSDGDDDDDDDLLIDSESHWDADALEDEDDGDDLSRDDDDVSVGGDDAEELMIEAELTSFLKRTRSGSHKPLRDFAGRQSPVMPPKHHHHHHQPLMPPPMINAADVRHVHGAAEDDEEVIDAGLESGESHGHELETM